VDSFTGNALYLEAHWQNPSLYRSADDRTGLQHFGELTAAFTLQVILPLLIIVFSFSSFTGEREKGTLQQALVTGIRRSQVVAGKLLGVGATFAAVVFPACTVAGVVFIRLASSAVDSSSLYRAAWMSVTYIIYLGIFLALSLAVSASVRTSRMALLALLGFWAFSCLVVPVAAADLARQLYPTPSAFEFHEQIYADKRNGIDGHNPEDQRLAALKQRVLEENGAARLEDLPFNFEGVVLQADEEYMNAVFDRRYGELWQTFERQNTLHRAAGLLSPLMLVRSISTSLAATDFAHFRHFAEAAEKHRREIVKMLNADMTTNSRTGGGPYFADQTLWARVPAFQYELPKSDWALSQQWPNFAALAVWMVVALAAAVLLARRMPVEPHIEREAR
jgi:ABC-2 type transport system permease protein